MAEEKKQAKQTETAAVEATTAEEDNQTPENKIPANLKSGMTVRVHELIKDIDSKGKERTRVQIFEGLILAVKKPKTASGSILVRKISHNNIGVEKIFPLRSPLIKEIEVTKEIKTRRAKLYFMPAYKKRLKVKQ